MASVAQIEPGGKLTLWTSTQGTYVVRSRLASLLSIPLHKVRVIVPHVGGGFGGKLQTVLEPYCALLAQRTGRAVKIVLSREEEFFLGKPRSAGVIHLKTGVTRDGMLVARQALMYFDTGFACHPRSTEIAPTIIRGPYNIPHVRFEAYCVYTNNAGFLDYKIPSILDLPLIEPVIVEEADEEGPFGARGIGEPPILAMAPAIANAIEDAVGVRITSLPITAEKVLQALREQNSSGGRGSG